MPRFYRVLSDNKLWQCWNCNPVAKSSHHRPPLQWTDRWNRHDRETNTKLVENYPLECREGLAEVKFTARAREIFLADPNKFTPDFFRDHWNSIEVYEVGQLDGICAFTTAQACLDWVANDPIKRDSIQIFRYVVFEGEYVCDAPENMGVVANLVEKVGNPLTFQEFTQRYIHTDPD